MKKGKIVQVGTPQELYMNPNSLFVAHFIGESNFLEGKVSRVEKDLCEVITLRGLLIRAKGKQGVKDGEKVNLTIRPERIQMEGELQKAENIISGEIQEIVYLGETIKYIITLEGGEEIVVKSQNREGGNFREKGQKVKIGWNLENCFII
jgi:ABC-type Fe3+/spermidine/putrescine transport system ATPase subunit